MGDKIEDLVSSVSRETSAMLATYSDMIRRWNPAINLVSKLSVGELFERHILDSFQILSNPLIPLGRWVDLGSGGGLPGLVVAIDAKDKSIDRHVVLVESDQRKATFLREVIRTLDLDAVVIADRIEAIEPLSSPVVSARALAPLAELCGFAHRHLVSGGMAIFHKGGSRAAEIDQARAVWNFDLVEIPSVTSPESAILYLRNLRHV